MTRIVESEDILARLADVFRAVFSDESIEVTDELSAADIEQWDSIAHVSLVFAIEEEFGLAFSMDDLEGIRNAGDFRTAIEKHLAGE